uniref:Uncharacterized protein n=1 Tax=Pseudo-nitzschia multistriata TaxID=183589 RepID=A0A448ZQZ3_9STRA
MLSLNIEVLEDFAGEGRMIAAFVHQDLVRAQDRQIGNCFRITLSIALLGDIEQEGSRQIQGHDAGFPS